MISIFIFSITCKSLKIIDVYQQHKSHYLRFDFALQRGSQGLDDFERVSGLHFGRREILSAALLLETREKEASIFLLRKNVLRKSTVLNLNALSNSI
jgi:hypothetical protein